MASFSKNAACAVLPLSLALAGATCLAQPTEDPSLGTVAQAVTPTLPPQCDVDGGDGGALAAYLSALEGDRYVDPGYTTWGWGPSYYTGYNGYDDWGPSYTSWGGFGGLGSGGYYYGDAYGWPYYGQQITPEPAIPGCP